VNFPVTLIMHINVYVCVCYGYICLCIVILNESEYRLNCTNCIIQYYKLFGFTFFWHGYKFFCAGRGSSQVGMLPKVMLDISFDITSKD
jgi:hypothetical protein